MPISLRTRIITAIFAGVLIAPLFAVVNASAQADAPIPLSGVWVEPTAGYGFVYAAISSARSSIDLSMYELSDVTLEHDLIARAKAGIDVRVVLNSAYNGTTENSPAAAILRAGSVHVVWAPSNQIFHAKYFVIDGTKAYIGTGNFVASDYSSTRDFWVEDTNPNDVDAIGATFDSDFRDDGASHQADGLVWSPGSTSALVDLISSAKHSLLVENEEMDSAPIEDALMGAARRGVSVDVAMTEDPSWTDALVRLASTGVHIRLLSDAQIYIHAKVICADCTAESGTVFIGSENFSTSSLSYNRELGVITTTLAAVRAIREAVSADFEVGATVPAPSQPPSNSSPNPTLSITSVIASIARGSYETLTASAKPGTTCTLTVVLPSGYTSQASGLGASTASATGVLTWNWWVSSETDPGTARATVTCGDASASRTFVITP